MMTKYNRDDIRALIVNNLQDKVRAEILTKNIEGLIDEYIEKSEFIKNADGKLPSAEKIKSWFRDPPVSTLIEVKQGVFEKCYEIELDKICIRNKLALEIFKYHYDLKWKVGDKPHPLVKNLIRLAKLVDSTENKELKYELSLRFNDMALVGAIRLYHMERCAYFALSQVDEIATYVKKAVLLIDKLSSKETKDQTIKGEIYIFDGLQKLNKGLKDGNQ